jgi:hypothetical protein
MIGYNSLGIYVDLVKDLDDVLVHKNSLDAATRNVKTAKGGFILTGNIAPIAHLTQKRHVKNIHSNKRDS